MPHKVSIHDSVVGNVIVVYCVFALVAARKTQLAISLIPFPSYDIDPPTIDIQPLVLVDLALMVLGSVARF
jgi:hypothetical protein